MSFAWARLTRLMPLIVFATLVSGAYALFRLHVQHENGLFGAWLLACTLGLLVLPYLDAPTALGGPQVFPLNGPQYTLFLEFLINFVWFPIRRFAPLATALALTAIGAVLVAVYGYGGDTTTSFWLGLPRVTTSFFAGVALFEIERRFDVAKRVKHAFWPLFAVMVVVLFYRQHPGTVGKLAWMLALSPLLVLSGLKAEMPGWVRKLCLFGGELSYPIYVLQYPLFCWANGILQELIHHKAPYFEMPVIFVVILGGSYAVLRLIDAPIRRMLAPRRAAPALAIPVTT